jgi:hypothetical protein
MNQLSAIFCDIADFCKARMGLVDAVGSGCTGQPLQDG